MAQFSTGEPAQFSSGGYKYASITEMAEAERLDRGYMGRLLQLTLLGPDIVDSVLNGSQSEHLALPALMKPLQTIWE
jgi:hypothetical protein